MNLLRFRGGTDAGRRRRLRGLAWPLVAVLFVLLPAEPAAAQAWRTKFSGGSAFAFWTDAPAGRPIQPGAVYTDVLLGAGEQAVLDDGRRYSTGYAYAEIHRYAVEADGSVTSLSWTYGWASGDALAFRLNPSLSSASIVATMETWTCTFDRCAAGEPGSVAVTLTGDGEVFRSVGNFTWTSRSATHHGHYNARWAQASASGDVLGATAGTSTYAFVARGNSVYVTSCHGC